MKIFSYKKSFFAKAILLTGIYLFSVGARCQDAQFSQFCNSPLTLNPSLTGAFNGDERLLVNYRDQWSSISSPFKTFAFSYDMGLMKRKAKTGFLGVGISFLNDNVGSSQLELNQVNLSLAYHVHLSKYNTLSAGIMGGFDQRSINFSSLQWTSEYDGTGTNYNPLSDGFSGNKSYFDFGSGLQWTYTKGEMYAKANNQLNISVGLAVFHVNQPNMAFYSNEKDQLPLKIVFNGNSQIGFSNSKYSFIPSFMYIQQGALKDIIVGASVRRKLQEESKYTGFLKGAAISLGGLYRVGDALIPYMQLEFANYAMGLSYDVNLSGLTKATLSKGGFEISLKFINPNPFNEK
jgi:type IX secretion system PorP/SprF family membrane protein